MTRSEIAVLVAVIANGLTFVQIVPQIVRLIRSGRTEGVSPTWAAVGMTINLGWLGYILDNQLWEAIPSVTAAIVSFAVALLLLIRNGVRVNAALRLCAVVVLASVVIQQFAGWTVLGTVLGLSNGLYLGPALITVWREQVPTGVSPSTWWLTAAEGFKWGLYGLLLGAVPIMVYGSTAVLLSSGVLLRLWLTRGRIQAAIGHLGR